MTQAPTTHPAPEQLAAYGLGKLTEAESDPIEVHLMVCKECQQVLAGQKKRDSLVSLLKKPPQAQVDTKLSASRRPSISKETAGEAVPPAASTVPERIGRYKIIDKIGKGGMGTVYKAHDDELDRVVALKVPHILPDDEEGLQRFKQEAKAAATFNHPNLCPVYDVGEHQGFHYLTMPLIAGKSLEALIKATAEAGKHLPERQVALVVRKLALALDHAHKKGVVHRDLKPSNVMIDEQNGKQEPLIMDFGLARRKLPSGERLTHSGQLMGTPAYMAPEQAAGLVKEMGPAGDIYSLGVILYELLTGRLPFDLHGLPLVAVLNTVVNNPPDPPTQHRPDLDPALADICMKAMAKKPEDRYPTMKAFADELSKFLNTSVPAPVGSSHGRDPNARLFAALAGDRAFKQKPGFSEKPGYFTPRRLSIAAAAAATLFALATIIYIATDNGTIKIELSDPTANVEIKVDGDTVTLTGLDEPLKLRTGKHELEVTGKGFKTFTREYVVKRGETTEIKVTLEPKPSDKPAVAADAPQKEGSPAAPAPDKKADYDAIATGKWIPVLRTEEELKEATGLRFENGILVSESLESNRVSILRQPASDVIIRAKVKKVTGLNLALGLRLQSREDKNDGYSVWFNGGNWFGVGMHSSRTYIDLAKFRTQENYDDWFELAFSAVDDQLTLYADGKTIRQVRHSAFKSGYASISAKRGRSLFKDVEVMILDKPAVGEKPEARELAKPEPAKPPTAAKPEATKPSFAWPADLLREGRIPAPDLSKAKVLFKDEFDDPKSGFPRNAPRPQNAESGYENGRYFIRELVADWSTRTVPYQFGSDFACEIVARAAGQPSDAWGIQIHNPEKVGISTRLTNQGTLSFFVYAENEQMRAPLAGPFKHPAIKSGGEFNTFLVIVRGQRVEAYVNGVAVCDPITVERDFTPGRMNIGIFARKANRPQAEFERITVYSTEGLPTPEQRLADLNKPAPPPAKPVESKPNPPPVEPAKPEASKPDPAKPPAKPTPAKPEAAKPGFAWPPVALRMGRVPAPDLSKRKPLFTDEMDDSTDGFEVLRDDYRESEYRSGKYIMRHLKGTGARYHRTKTITPGEYVYEVVGRLQGKPTDAWGLQLNNYQQKIGLKVALRGDGSLATGPGRVASITEGFLGPKSERFQHSAIKSGEQSNTLLLVVRTGRVEVYVNGVAVCDPIPVDRAWAPNHMQFTLDSAGEAWAEIDRFTVYSAEGLPTPEQRLADLTKPAPPPAKPAETKPNPPPAEPAKPEASKPDPAKPPAEKPKPSTESPLVRATQKKLETPITVAFTDAKLLDVLKEIEKQLEIKFRLAEGVNPNQTVTVTAADKPAKDVLDDFLKKRGLKWEVHKKQNATDRYEGWVEISTAR